MTSFFYFDQDNQKQGPVTEEQLKELAAQNLINPETQLETDGGDIVLAGQLPDLFPLESAQSTTTASTVSEPSEPNQFATQEPLKNLKAGRDIWSRPFKPMASERTAWRPDGLFSATSDQTSHSADEPSDFAQQAPATVPAQPSGTLPLAKLIERMNIIAVVAVFAIVFHVSSSILGPLPVLFIEDEDIYHTAVGAVFIASIIAASCVCFFWKKSAIVQAVALLVIAYNIFSITLGNLIFLLGIHEAVAVNILLFITSITLAVCASLFWNKSTVVQTAVVFTIALRVYDAVLGGQLGITFGFQRDVTIYAFVFIVASVLAIGTCLFWKKSTIVQATMVFAIAFFLSFLTLKEPFFLLGGYSSGFARATSFIGALILASGICLIRKELLDCLAREFSIAKGMALIERIGGSVYHGSNDISQDYKEAIKWLHRAAEQGHAEAQCVLGGCYYMGTGVPQNHTESTMWLRKAAQQGHEDAQELLREAGLSW